MAIDQNKVTIAISRDDPKWNWLLKYHDAIDYDDLLISIVYLLDKRLENAELLLGEVMRIPTYQMVPDEVNERIFTYLTREET